MTIPSFSRPNILSLVGFEDADCFDCEEGDRVRFDTALEALEAMLDESELCFCGEASRYLDTTTLFLSVRAYKRMSVDDKQRERWAGHLVESLREWFSEDHANEDGDDLLDPDHEQQLLTKSSELVSWYLDHVRVWQCTQLRTWTFDNDDLRELVAELRPDWLTRVNPQ